MAKNIFGRWMNWQIEEYSGQFCAMTKIDIMVPSLDRRDHFRSTFGLIFLVDPKSGDGKGIDGLGNRASGSRSAISIDGKPKPDHPLVTIGEEIVTPFGEYRVEFLKYGHSSINYDHLSLIEIGDGKEA